MRYQENIKVVFSAARLGIRLLNAFEFYGKAQLSVMEVDGPDIFKYGEVIPGGEPGIVAGIVK